MWLCRRLQKPKEVRIQISSSEEGSNSRITLELAFDLETQSVFMQILADVDFDLEFKWDETFSETKAELLLIHAVSWRAPKLFLNKICLQW